jgi:tetratricopeptide (TPR) repeat protein
VEGTITAVSAEKITLDKAGTALQFNVNEVVKVTFGDDPAELVKARDAIVQGQIESAQATLKTINTAALARDLVKQDAEYYRAYCDAKLALAGTGNLAAADAALFEFVRTNRDSYHTYEATELLGNLALAQGKFSDAEKRFGFLGRAPWPGHKLRASVMEARALTAQNKFPEALAKYESIIMGESGDAGPEVNRQKLLATVGKAVCLGETGKADEAIQLLEDVIRDNDSKDSILFARTYNALGNCYLKSSRPKDALLAYLHVDLMFSGDSESHAEALFYLSKLWGEMNKADRALAARTLLKERYGGSIWNKAP